MKQKQKQNITYYFVELSQIFFISILENIIQENSDIEYLFDYFSDNDLNLYLRIFLYIIHLVYVSIIFIIIKVKKQFIL